MKKTIAVVCFFVLWTVGLVLIGNRRIAAVERRAAEDGAYWIEQREKANHQAVEILTQAEESCARGTLTIEEGLHIIRRVVEGTAQNAEGTAQDATPRR